MDDPIPQYSEIIRNANDLNLAYIHLVESRIKGSEDVVNAHRLDFAYPLFNGSVLVTGGYSGESARRLVDEGLPGSDVAVGFGRHFIANPDLVFRLKHGLTVNAHDRASFYTLKDPKGYIDYPLSKEYLETGPA